MGQYNPGSLGSFIIFFCNSTTVPLELRNKINGSLRNKYLQTFWKCFSSRKGNIPLSTLIIWEFTTQGSSRVCAVQSHNHLQIKPTNSRFHMYKWTSKSQSSFYIITKGDADFLFLNGLANVWIIYQYLSWFNVVYHPSLALEKKWTGVKMQNTPTVNSNPWVSHGYNTH